MILSERLTLGFMIVYIASLPLLWPPLFAIHGMGKVIVLADFAFAALVVVLLGSSPQRLLPIQRDVEIFSANPSTMIRTRHGSDGPPRAELSGLVGGWFCTCGYLYS